MSQPRSVGSESAGPGVTSSASAVQLRTAGSTYQQIANELGYANRWAGAADTYRAARKSAVDAVTGKNAEITKAKGELATLQAAEKTASDAVAANPAAIVALNGQIVTLQGQIATVTTQITAKQAALT